MQQALFVQKGVTPWQKSTPHPFWPSSFLPGFREAGVKRRGRCACLEKMHTEYLFISWNKLEAEAKKQKQNGGIIAQNVLENVSMHLRNTLLANLIDVTLLLIFDNFPLFDETLRHILYCCAFQ